MIKLSSPNMIATVLVLGSFVQIAMASPQASLTERGQRFADRYAIELDDLRTTLSAQLPKQGKATAKEIDAFLASDAFDPKLVKFVVLHQATPHGLAEFAQRHPKHAELVDALLTDPALMKRMLIADGAQAKQERRSYGPAQFGPAMKIYTQILQTSQKANSGVLQRLALATSLAHAVPITQSNPVAQPDAPEFVDPVQRYLHFQRAYLSGELDAAFDRLSTWELRMVVNGDETDEALAWGRKTLRQYRPDHVYNSDYGWRYVGLVTSDVKYGSGDVKYDRPELQKYANILMNGGVCGRCAFIGRFILRSFGIPTIARPSRGHAALAHWTPAGWVVNLGGGWGAGWTKTPYGTDRNFLATTQARQDAAAFVEVKRAQWAGDVLGEKRAYDEKETPADFWNAIAIRRRDAIIKRTKAVELDALGEELGEADKPTIAERVMASPVTAKDKQVSYRPDGVIVLPAAAYTKPRGNTGDVVAMKSFAGGLQIYLPRFFPQGKTIMRGGTWKGPANDCTSGKRMLSGGYGRYENWGLRVALSADSDTPKDEMTLDLGNGVTLELVYIQPGTFVMGGESETDGRFQCVEVPKHEVQLTRGFYLGKYEVTQAQYRAMMGSNPSKSSKGPNFPVDNVGESDAILFCQKLADTTRQQTRLPTEAEWEYASRAGQDTKWFFGDEPSQLGKFAWFRENAGGKSHPVGQKVPNPWGLYDIYGNVCERIADKYAKNYYSVGPRVDPTGPSPGTKSHLEYQVNVPRGGDYTLTARVVTVNDGQRLNVATEANGSTVTWEMPFTHGSWLQTAPITVRLTQGINRLQFWRDQPPQYGIAIKEFMLTPIQ